MEALPFVDEHSVVAEAPADVVWNAVRVAFERPLTGASKRYAELVGAEQGRAFEVERAERPGLLRLVGAHHFSRYALTFTFEELGPDRTRLTARTNAAFPGVAGQLYKTAVIRSGAHRVLTRAMIGRLAKRAHR